MKKKCQKCKKIKNTNLFHSNKKEKDGLSSFCKQCRSEYEKERYKHNRDIILQKVRKYRKVNRELIKFRERQKYKTNDEYRQSMLKYQKDYRRNNNKKVLQYAKEYRAKFKSIINKKIGKYRQTPKGRHGQLKKHYYRKLAKLRGNHSFKQWHWLKEKYGFICLSCGRKEPEIELTIDHIIPITRNGSNYIFNIQPLCLSCNSSKKDKIIDYRIGKP